MGLTPDERNFLISAVGLLLAIGAVGWIFAEIRVIERGEEERQGKR